MTLDAFRIRVIQILGSGVDEHCIDKICEAAQLEFSSHHKGMEWELLFCTIAEEKGLTVLSADNNRHDRIVAGKRCQVKHIDELRSGYVSIDNMRPVKANGGERGYLLSEYDIMVLKHRDKVFIIPSREMEDVNRPGWVKSKIRIANYRAFVDQWDLFHGIEPVVKGLLF